LGNEKRNKKDLFGNLSPGKNGQEDSIRECPPERKIEQLVLKKVTLREKADLFSHFQCCFTCNELHQTIVSFYQGVKGKFVSEGTLPGMPSPIPELFSEYVIHLSPASPAEPHENDYHEDYELLSSLSSSDGQVKGSFLLSRSTTEILAAISSTNGHRLCHIPLHVGNFKEKFLTDSGGIAVIGIYEPSLFMNTHANIFLPLLDITTSVGTELLDEEYFNPGPIPGFPVDSVQVYIDDNNGLCLELCFRDEEVSHPLTAVFAGRGETRMVPILDGIAVYSKAHLGSPIQILIYPA
jgi:hypothetical protein